MDFYVKLGIFQVEGAQLKTNYSFFTNPPGITTSHPGPPTRETRSVVWESWILLSQEELPENSEVLCLCNFQSQLLDFTGGWTRATDTPLSSALYLRTLAIHLWKTSDPALSSYFPTQNIWPRDGK